MAKKSPKRQLPASLAAKIPRTWNWFTLECHLDSIWEAADLLAAFVPPPGHGEPFLDYRNAILKIPTDAVETFLVSIKKWTPHQLPDGVAVIRSKTAVNYQELTGQDVAPGSYCGEVLVVKNYYLLPIDDTTFAHSLNRELLDELVEHYRSDDASLESLTPEGQNAVWIHVNMETCGTEFLNWLNVRPSFFAGIKEYHPGNAAGVLLGSALRSLKSVELCLDASSKTKIGLQITGEYATTELETARQTLVASQAFASNAIDHWVNFPLQNIKNKSGHSVSFKYKVQKALSGLCILLLKYVTFSTDAERLIASVELKKKLKDFVPSLVQDGFAAWHAECSANNTRKMAKILQALKKYHDLHGHFPPPVIVDSRTQMKRSWRVELLPQMGRYDLYEQYRFDSPHDSYNNRKVLDAAPDLYRDASLLVGNSCAFYLVTGPDTVCDGEKPSFDDITDPTSGTVMLLLLDRGTPWTSPEDIPFDEAVDLDSLPSPHGEDLTIGTADCASVRSTRKSQFTPERWRNSLLRNSGSEGL